MLIMNHHFFSYSTVVTEQLLEHLLEHLTWVNSKGASLTMDMDCIFTHLTQLTTIQIAIIMIITITKDSKRLVNHPDRENPNALKIFPSQLVFNAAAIASESFATFFILSSWVQRGMDIFRI